MFIYRNDSIESGSEIEIPFPAFGGVMNQKKDLTLVIKATGGETTGLVNVTMGLSVWCDIDPQQHVDGGSAINTETYINLTPSISRVDQNTKVGASEIQFVGTTEDFAWLDLDDLNADKMKLILTFSAAPSVTPATILVKLRRDSI